MNLNSIIKIFFLLGMGMHFLSCSSKKIKLDESTQVEKKGVITLTGNTLRDKKDSFSITLMMNNINKKNTLFIQKQDIHCFRGSKRGISSISKVKSEENHFTLLPEELKEMKVHCKFSEKQMGDFKIVINKIYDNPKSDGITKGKVLAENLEFIVTPVTEN